jgi:catechol 2,3-dioxygenase-like lactoylglutathione lyase family enzyme
MFKGVRTLAIYVTDMERSRDFYTRILGFRVRVDVHPALSFLESADKTTDIYLEGGMKPCPVDNQSCRLSFFLEAEKSAAAAYAALKAAGVTLLQAAPEPVSDDTACFQFADPDGNILEVSGRI